MTKINPKVYIGISVAIAVIVVLTLFMVLRKQSSSSAGTQKSTLPQNEALQQVENSVKVTVDKGADGHRVNFVVTNIPDKYTTIEYEFSYMTGSGRLQGGNSSPADIKDHGYTKEILLGTCSAGGACTYDAGVTSIKFSIIFTAGTERRTFEKEFSL